MWPFTRSEPVRHESCTRQRAELQEAFEGLQRELKSVRLDFEDLYERTYRLHQRIAKRAAIQPTEPAENGASHDRAEPDREERVSRAVPASAHLARRFRGF